MAKRRFKLPGIQDLNRDQEDVRALPKEGQHLIIGGPGTGKSVLALLRSRRHHLDKENYVFLIYNRLLNQASNQLFETDLKSQTWLSWFQRQFTELTRERSVPKLPAINGWQEIDWDKVLTIINNLEQLPEKELPYLIIDEGQDMPPQFYQALASLGFENFFVVADQNQQIVPDKNSTRQDIQDVLAIDPNDVIELKKNYRNQYSIARLAREFYTGDPASPPPELPEKRASVANPILFEYESEKFMKIIQSILKMADGNPSSLIGIITPNNAVRNRYVNALNKTDITLDNGKPQISTYHTQSSTDLSFDEAGIMVINAQSCKGLEFDIEYLADINEHKYWENVADQRKRLFYVMVARARRRIIMLKEGGKPCPIEEILPTDPEILERQS
jgi:DNA helicase II / ATP-dependent DNA helicase PcrA